MSSDYKKNPSINLNKISLLISYNYFGKLLQVGWTGQGAVDGSDITYIRRGTVDYIWRLY